MSNIKKRKNRLMIGCISLIGMTIVFGYIGYNCLIVPALHRSPFDYDGKNTVGDFTYKDEVTSTKRYLAIGFDDFRSSDFSLVLPLLEEYGYKATFNRIAYDGDFSETDISEMDDIRNAGCEIGDHTWYHCNYIYNDPLFNGQNPESADGGQIPFPTNEQLRNDYGDRKNAFGFELIENISANDKYPTSWSEFNATWEELTDEECQTIRDSFSIYADKSGMLETLDELSNRYLGTSGNSFGSWNEELGCYEGGIYTGAKTSCNHEIWERILEVTEKLYQDQYDSKMDLYTWSWPGSRPSPFIFEKDGRKYYDSEYTISYNYLARFPSSLYFSDSAQSKPLYRSWNDVLRNSGYLLTHDNMYPSRTDGQSTPMMSKQLIYNAQFSREDALIFSTNRSISYMEIATAYPKEFFDDKLSKSYASQMYDDGGQFYQFIESIRKNTSNGMIQGEVIDSEDSYSEEMFLRQVFEYCKETGVEVVSKAQAYDICFNNPLTEGNLIYNPELRNTADEFMPDAESIPSNPDGYTGECHVDRTGDSNILITEGQTEYNHFGIPIGDMRYQCEASGDGEIIIYAIKNSDKIDCESCDLEVLQKVVINSPDFKRTVCDFAVKNNPLTEYEQHYGGYGDKIMGIRIVYSEGLRIKNINLENK